MACCSPPRARRSRRRERGRSARSSGRPIRRSCSSATPTAARATGRSRPSWWPQHGQLASIGASPFADLQTAPCWVEISHDGQFLFTVNTGSGEISSYSINPDGSLVLLGSTPFGSAGAGAVDARLSPDGKTLLVDGSKANVDRVVRGQRRKPHRAVQLTHAAARGRVRSRPRHRLTIAVCRRLGVLLTSRRRPPCWIRSGIFDMIGQPVGTLPTKG